MKRKLFFSIFNLKTFYWILNDEFCFNSGMGGWCENFHFRFLSSFSYWIVIIIYLIPVSHGEFCFLHNNMKIVIGKQIRKNFILKHDYRYYLFNIKFFFKNWIVSIIITVENIQTIKIITMFIDRFWWLIFFIELLLEFNIFPISNRNCKFRNKTAVNFQFCYQFSNGKKNSSFILSMETFFQILKWKNSKL